MVQPLKKLLPTIFNKHNDWKFELLTNWPSIVGNLETQVRLEKIYHDTLVLSVQDSCWLQELYLLSPLLIRTINKTLDQPRVKHLRFKTAGVQYKKTKILKNKVLPEIKRVILSKKEEEALNTLEDEQLKKVLKSFLIRCYQEK